MKLFADRDRRRRAQPAVAQEDAEAAAAPEQVRVAGREQHEPAVRAHVEADPAGSSRGTAAGRPRARCRPGPRSTRRVVRAGDVAHEDVGLAVSVAGHEVRRRRARRAPGCRRARSRSRVLVPRAWRARPTSTLTRRVTPVRRSRANTSLAWFVSGRRERSVASESNATTAAVRRDHRRRRVARLPGRRPTPR